MKTDDPMPADYYNCDDSCRPDEKTSGGYWKIYTCEAGCAKTVLPNSTLTVWEKFN